MSIFEILKNWNDRESIQSGVERASFNVHTVYQEELTALARRMGHSDLKQYWNELAREYISCVGQVDSRRRLFSSDLGYRSSYLDRLAEERNSQGIAESAALHPCERLFNETVESNGLGAVLTADAETLKNVIEDADSPDNLSRNSTIEELRENLHLHLSRHAFKKSGSQSQKKLNNGLVLTVAVEKSKASQLFQLLINLKVSMRGSAKYLYFNDFSRLIPGFRYNAIVLSNAGVSYGLKAHASVIGEVARSFDEL